MFIRMLSRREKYMLQLRHVFALLLLVVLPACKTFAQRGGDEVKKSKQTQVIDGKKFYMHTVEKGQTLYAIAKAYELTVNDVILENPSAIDGIKPGLVLKIPATKPKSGTTATGGKDTVAYFWHNVEGGQTLYSLSKLYSTSVESIEKLNPEAKQGLKAGQRLKIPGVRNPVLISTRPDTVKKDTLPFVENKKDLYHVAFFAPFGYWRAEEIDVDKIVRRQEVFPPKTEFSLQLYEGMLLALDSLQKRGVKIRLHVYDSDENDSASIQTILSRPEFASMDLIIGPLYPGPFTRVAKFAAEKKICAVSPVSQNNRVLFGNPYALKTTASVTTQMEQLADFVIKKHPRKKVLVVSSANPKDVAFVNAFRKTYDTLRNASGNDTVQVLRGIGNLSASLMYGDTTVLIIPTNSQTYVTDLTRALNGIAEKNKLIVYGTSAWLNYENLDFEYLQAIQLRFPTPYFIDYDSPAVKKVRLDYQRAYGGDVNMYVMMGYDLAWYFGDALYRHGTGFHAKLPELKSSGLQQRFDFFRSDAGSGYENRGMHVVKMEEYKLLKEE